MLSKSTNAKIVAISEEKAQKLGVYKQSLRGVLIDGVPVEVNIINENSKRWNLPNVVVKAEAYAQAIAQGKGAERFVNVFSNREKNFNRWSTRQIVQEWAAEKTDAVLAGFDYGYHGMVNQIVLQQPFNDAKNWTMDEINNYAKEIQENELLAAKAGSLSGSQAMDLRTEIISNYQVLLLVLHNGFLSIRQRGNQNPADQELTKKIVALVSRVKLNLEHLGYSFVTEPASRTNEGNAPEVTKPDSQIGTSPSDPVGIWDSEIDPIPNVQLAVEKEPVETVVEAPSESENTVSPESAPEMQGMTEATPADSTLVPDVEQSESSAFTFGQIDSQSLPDSIQFDQTQLEPTDSVVFSFGDIQPMTMPESLKYDLDEDGESTPVNSATLDTHTVPIQSDEIDTTGRMTEHHELNTHLEPIPEVKVAKMVTTASVNKPSAHHGKHSKKDKKHHKKGRR